MSATKCNKEGCWDGPAAGMVNLVQEPRTSLGKGGFVQLYIKHERPAHKPARLTSTLFARLSGGLSGESKAN